MSQLSGVRRAAASAQNTSLHLQHLQAQLSREREHLQQTRQNLFSKTQILNKNASSTTAANPSNTSGTNQTYANVAALNTQVLELPNIFQNNNQVRDTRFLLSK